MARAESETCNAGGNMRQTRYGVTCSYPDCIAYITLHAKCPNPSRKRFRAERLHLRALAEAVRSRRKSRRTPRRICHRPESSTPRKCMTCGLGTRTLKSTQTSAEKSRSTHLWRSSARRAHSEWRPGQDTRHTHLRSQKSASTQQEPLV